MQMRIWMWGVGVKLGETGFSLNAVTQAWIYFRSIEKETPYVLTISDHLTVGSGNGTFGFANVKTHYFVVNLSAHPWLHRKGRLIHRKGRVSISGSTLYTGCIDIRFSVFDAYGEPEHELRVASRHATGLQVASSSVTGTISPKSFKQLPKQLRDSYVDDYEDNTWTLPAR